MNSKFKIAPVFEFLILNFELTNWFSPSGLSIALLTVSRMLDKVARLYEQDADEQRIEAYLKRWWQWVRTGVDGFLISAYAFQLGIVGSLRASRFSPYTIWRARRV